MFEFEVEESEWSRENNTKEKRSNIGDNQNLLENIYD